MLDLILKVGLSATPTVMGVVLYEKNPMLSGIMIVIGLLLTSAVIISEIAYKHKELENRVRGFLR